MSKIFFMLCLFAAGLIFSSPALALEGEWASADQVRARLISALDKSGFDRQFAGALEVQLTPGWHTYWRMPGEAGLAPRFDWTSSKNVKSVNVLWPVPQRKDEMGFQTFGYSDNVIFPLEFYLDKVNQDTNVDLNFDIMVCHEICIPQNLKLSLMVPAAEDGEAVESGQRALVDFSRDKVPHSGDFPQLKIKAVVAGPDALVVNVFSSFGFAHIDVFVDVEGVVLSAKPKIEVDEKDQKQAMITLPKPADVENLKQEISGKTLSLVLTNGREAIEKELNF